ncbi:hypothetical protein JNUCC32_23685 [Paenibacillus sp. JNUCC32]|uniref:hypothetical protein n=1 Tax=Paenibacillus TaxID=44249 RepID=UPI0017879910|nr:MULTISPECIES: hypothetical protein [Paenibacillus]QOT09136.1 hypothetical protein JNUCC32_23685 [Paenibacillus sp. JNUCC-32]GIP05623.1 hypothetical protein J28TS4_40300 [Paenibacillus lautus]
MNKKKLLTMMLAVTTAMSCFSGMASASSQDLKAPAFDKDHQLKIESLIDDLISVRLEKSTINPANLITDTASTPIQALDDKEEELINLLEAEGVRPITEEERTILNKSTYLSAENGNHVTAGPPTWGPYPYVDMLTYGEKTITVNGRSHTIWVNYAVPKNGGGAPLVKHYDSIKLMKQPFEFAKAREKVIDVLIQRAAGKSKLFEASFHEFWWPAIQGYTSFDTHDALISYAVKMKYVWVKNGSTWQLKASSNNVQTNERHSERGYLNGRLTESSKLETKNVWGELYDQIETLAVSEGNTYLKDPVRAIIYRDYDKKEVLSVFPHYAGGPLDLAP